MNTVHLFYNAEDYSADPNNAWEKFGGNFDSLRLFAVAAETWARLGWNVNRLSTRQQDRQFGPTPFLDKGQAYFDTQTHGPSWYPLEKWQFIARAKDVTYRHGEDPTEPFLFATYDVINYGVDPDTFAKMIGNQFRAAGGPGFMGPRCVNFQADHFSLSLICCNRLWLDLAEATLLDYDQGNLPKIQRAYVSDETVLQTYPPIGTETLKFQHFPIHTAARNVPFVHFARSTLQPYLRSVPLS